VNTSADPRDCDSNGFCHWDGKLVRHLLAPGTLCDVDAADRVRETFVQYAWTVTFIMNNVLI
jgi:hypothetical protein